MFVAELDVLLPHREGEVGAMGWTAGPGAASRPDATLERLDAWAQRHHERTDAGKDVVDRLVSHALRERPARAVELMGAVTKLATLLTEATGSFASRDLPPEFVELRTEEAREQLTVNWTSDDDASIAVRDRGVAVLARTSDPDPEVRGWWLWGVDGDGRADDRGGAWPQLVTEDLAAEIAKSIGSDQAKGVGPFDAGGIAGPPTRNSGGR